MLKQLKKTIASHAQQTAIIYAEKNYSYQWLLKHADKTAVYLQQQRIKHVAFCLYNNPINILAYLGAWFAGCNACPLNPRLSHYELQKVLVQLKPELIIVETTRINDEFIKLCCNQKIKILTVDNNWINSDFFNSIKNCKEKDLREASQSSETYHLTSGTLGHVKVAVHNLKQIINYAYNRSQDIGLNKQDKLLISLSLNHAYAFSYQLLPALVLGLTMVLIKKFSDSVILHHIIHSKVTNIALLPSMCYFLALHAKNKLPFKHKLRYAMVAGDATSEAIKIEFQQVFNTPLYTGIGMTELFGYAINNPRKHNLKTAGKPFRQTEISVRNINHDKQNDEPIGELYIRNEATLLSYLNAEELTQASLQSGWLKTGDVGYIDEQGYLNFMGRKKDIIIKGGSNIMPLEIEQALYLHPNILQAAVIGVSDKIWGKIIHAYIILKNGNKTTGSKEIKELLATYLAEYKLPDKILFVKELPTNATGKIDRAELERLENSHE